ncbi:MAG: MaoC/PaaZ C-terminal domain-containing protein [bacterium]
MTDYISDWTVIDQQLINQFAELTGDMNPIHIDAAFCARLPQRTTIAHGLLSLALTPKLVTEAVAGAFGQSIVINYGYDNLRFPGMVPVGARVRVHVQSLETEKRGSGILHRLNISLEVEGSDVPGLVADWLLYQPT